MLAGTDWAKMCFESHLFNGIFFCCCYAALPLHDLCYVLLGPEPGIHNPALPTGQHHFAQLQLMRVVSLLRVHALLTLQCTLLGCGRSREPPLRREDPVRCLLLIATKHAYLHGLLMRVLLAGRYFPYVWPALQVQCEQPR